MQQHHRLNRVELFTCTMHTLLNETGGIKWWRVEWTTTNMNQSASNVTFCVKIIFEMFQFRFLRCVRLCLIATWHARNNNRSSNNGIDNDLFVSEWNSVCSSVYLLHLDGMIQLALSSVAHMWRQQLTFLFCLRFYYLSIWMWRVSTMHLPTAAPHLFTRCK